MDNTEIKLINVNDFLEHWNKEYRHLYPCDVYKVALANFPTVDAELVKHGRWITHNKGQNNWVECSECNTVGSPFWKRCPICEAKMEVDLNGI